MFMRQFVALKWAAVLYNMLAPAGQNETCSDTVAMFQSREQRLGVLFIWENCRRRQKHTIGQPRRFSQQKLSYCPNTGLQLQSYFQYVCVCVCVCVYVCVCVCVCMCVCVFLKMYLLACSITLEISNTTCFLHLVFTVIVSSLPFGFFLVNLLTVLLSVLF